MSFFTFNQLYGQWHVMSRAVSCPNEKGKGETHKPEENLFKVEEVFKDTLKPKVKSEILTQEKDKCYEESAEVKPSTVTVSPATTEPNNLSKEEEEEVGQSLVEDKKELEHETQCSNPDPHPEHSEREPEAEENLEEIEYLHLPSQDLEKLKERIKHSSHAKRKFRLWKETMGMCIYCGKHIPALDFVTGVQSDIEHIIPQAIGGTSSFDNLVCSCRKCNRAKGDRTAMDYVLTLNSRKQAEYFNLLRLLVSSGSMSEEKYFNLLRPVRLVKL